MYLALDVETGGIGPPCSLLTAYFAVYTPSLQPVDELDLAIKPDDGLYHLTAEGMAVNKINIVEHNERAMTLKETSTVLYTWLQRMYTGLRLTTKLIPVGQGVRWDIEFMIASKLISRGSWDQFVGHQMLDTASVANFLKVKGKIPVDTNGSLVGLMAYFGLKFAWPGPHNARADAIAGIDLLRAMMEVT